MHIKEVRSNWDDILTKAFLEEEYIVKGKSSYTISREQNIPKSTILKTLQRFGIERRQGSKAKPPRWIDITGQKFNMLTVIKFAGKNYHGVPTFLCQCDCGNTKIIQGRDIRSGHTRSCGCLSKEVQLKTCQRKYIGKIGSTMWKQIIRGAKIRNIPLEITHEFISKLFDKQQGKCALSGVDISAEYSNPTASLDRINNSKGYVKGNVQWVHKLVNLMKNKFTDKEFIQICHTVSTFQTNRHYQG